jgi:predicted RNase H-like HicB family nuclease
MAKFPVTIYQDEEGWYVVECPIVPGCLSQGQTEEKSLQNIREAIQLCLEVRREKGLPPTIRSVEVEIPVRA